MQLAFALPPGMLDCTFIRDFVRHQQLPLRHGVHYPAVVVVFLAWRLSALIAGHFQGVTVARLARRC